MNLGGRYNRSHSKLWVTGLLVSVILIIGCIEGMPDKDLQLIKKLIDSKGAEGELVSIDKHYPDSFGSIYVTRVFYNYPNQPKDTIVLLIGIKRDTIDGDFAFPIYVWILNTPKETRRYLHLLNTDSIQFVIGTKDSLSNEKFWNEIAGNLQSKDIVRLK